MKEKKNNSSGDEHDISLPKLLANLPGIAYRCKNDDDWTMQFLSSGCYELTGYSPREFINNVERTFASIIHPDDRQLGRGEIKDAIAEQTSFEIEYRIIHKSGDVKWIWEKGSAVYNKDHKADHIEGFITDITERKKTEQELNDKWNNYHIVVENLPLPVVIFTFEGKILYANPKALELIGMQATAYAEKNIFDFVAPQFLKLLEERRSGLKPGEALPAFEVEAHNLKGEKFFIEIHSAAIFYNGAPAMQTIISDISARRQLEQEKFRSEVAVQTAMNLKEEVQKRSESEEKLKAIFDSSTHLIYTIDTNLKITSFNNRYKNSVKDIYGFELEHGMSIATFAKFFIEENFELMKISYQKAFEGENVRFEVSHVDTNKNFHHREIYLHPIKANGRVVEVATIAQDVTDRKKSEQQILEQAAHLKAIFESGNHSIYTIDKEHRITSYNNRFRDSVLSSYGIRLNDSTTISLLDDHLTDDSRARLEDAYKKAFRGENVSIEVCFKTINGASKYREIFLQAVVINQHINEIACISTDITDRRNHEQQIIEQAAHLKAIFESGTQLMWTVNRNIALTSFNENYDHAIFNTYGVHPEINKDLNKPKKKFASDEYHAFWDKKYELVFNGQVVEFETQTKDVSGNICYRRILLHPIFNDKNEVIEASGMGYEITEQKLAQQEIAETRAQLAALINSTTDIVLSIDRHYNIVQFNKLLYDMSLQGRGIEVKKGTSVFEILDPAQYGHLKDIYERVFNENKNIIDIEQFELNGGRKAYFETNYNPITQHGTVTGIAIFSRNITDKISAEKELKSALTEKEVLLKEVHHRVKNNLQVITSILNLQTSYLHDKQTIQLLRECQNRIKTMAFIHESLYQTKDFEKINFSDYIINLVKNLFYSYDANEQKIKSVFDVDTIFLNLDMSIPCGLIVNELVSNAFKYAFADRKEGFVKVEVKKMTNGKIRMQVSDNGRGLPENIDFRHTESLGLQLVNILVDQVNGVITLDKRNGTSFEIIF